MHRLNGRQGLAAALLALPLSGLQAQDGGVDRRIEAVLGAAAPYEHAFKALQAAVARGDAAAVAALVHYPIGVRIGGRTLSIASADELQRRYAQVFTPAIAAVVTAQKYDELFVNAQGVMFGSGQVWMNGVCADRRCSRVDVKVVAIQDGAAR
jgi:hypothetical protein